MDYKKAAITPIHHTNGDVEYFEMCKREKSARLDIRKIDETIANGTSEKLIDLHRKLDCNYQACVIDWGKSMWGYSDEFGFDIGSLDDNSIKDNLNSMRAKIESFGKGFNCKNTKPHHTSVNVNNTNSNTNEIAINFSFDQARKKIEEMSSLTDEQTQEALEKITEIEDAVKAKDTKKSKWEKVKPAIKWLADKSFDVGMIILPLLIKLQE